MGATIDSTMIDLTDPESLYSALHSGLLANDRLKLHISPPAQAFDAFDYISPQTHHNMVGFDMFEFGVDDINDLLEPSALISNETMAASDIGTESGDLDNTSGVNLLDECSEMPKDAVEKISNLNFELRRQLNIISTMAKEYSKSTTTPSYSSDNPWKNSNLSRALDSMVQGLQTFHELLLEIFGTANRNCEETPSHTGSYTSQGTPPQVQSTLWQTTKPLSSLLSLTDVRDTDSIASISESSSKLHATPRPDSKSRNPLTHNSPVQITLLDMSTSLLVISCYMDLIRLCREVFAVLRGTLSSPGHRTTLTLSGFQFSGALIHQDSDLQIIILTQVVVRLVNRIGFSLGHPHSSAPEVSGDASDARVYSKGISPQLLDFVLRQEGFGGQPSWKGGLEALREEIRRLNEVVYRPV
jgi:hypothetical protein